MKIFTIVCTAIIICSLALSVIFSMGTLQATARHDKLMDYFTKHGCWMKPEYGFFQKTADIIVGTVTGDDFEKKDYEIYMKAPCQGDE
jgi:hypothetical protein